MPGNVDIPEELRAFVEVCLRIWEGLGIYSWVILGLVAGFAIFLISAFRFERRYISDFEPADEKKLPKPNLYMWEMNDIAGRHGFQLCGWFVNKTKKWLYRAAMTIWVSRDGRTLLQVASGKFFGSSRLKIEVTVLYSRPVGRSVLVTTDYINISLVSEFFDTEYIRNGDLYELWARHESRMALWEGKFEKFDRWSPLKEVEDLERRRVGVLVDTGYARWINKQRQTWRFTIKGAIRGYFKARRQFRQMDKQRDRISKRRSGEALGGYDTKGIWAAMGRYSVMPPDKVIEDAALDKGDVVLDFGCTDWRYTMAAAKAVGAEGKVYALEIYPEVFEKINERAKEEGLENIETIQSDCMTGLDDDSVDVVFLHEILKALREEKRQKVLKELYRVLKVGGVLSFSSHHAKKDEIISTVTAGGLFRVAKKGEDLYRFVKVPV